MNDERSQQCLNTGMNDKSAVPQHRNGASMAAHTLGQCLPPHLKQTCGPEATARPHGMPCWHQDVHGCPHPAPMRPTRPHAIAPHVGSLAAHQHTLGLVHSLAAHGGIEEVLDGVVRLQVCGCVGMWGSRSGQIQRLAAFKGAAQLMPSAASAGRVSPCQCPTWMR